MAINITSVDGNTVNSTSAYRVAMPYGSPAPKAVALTLAQRRNSAPLYGGMSETGWRFPLRISGVAGAGVSHATFRENVEQWFRPGGSSLTRTILATWHDTTAVQIDVLIESLDLVADAGIIQSVEYIAVCVAPLPYWQATSLTTSAASPATVTNAGNTPALPTIELTTATHVTRRVCTVQSASSQLPLIAYPVVFLLSDAAATSDNVFVYVEGVSVPCYVDDSGLSTSRVWALIDAVSATVGPATNVDIIYGTGLDNPLCQTLPDGGLDWDDATNCHNTQWEWNDITVTTNPNRPSAWRPALSGNHSAAADVSYQITSEAAAATTIGIGAAGTYDNSADSLRLTVGATASTLTNFRRLTANLDGVNARAYVRHRVFGTTNWLDSWTTLANATVTTAITVTGAAEIMAGIENFGATADPSTLTLGSASNDNRLAITNGPTVVIGSAQNYDVYNGSYTIDANLAVAPEAFDNAIWLKTRSSISADAVAAPDGATTADKLVEDATASNTHHLRQEIVTVSGQTYTASVHVKADERTQVRVALTDGTGGTISQISLDLADGSTISSSGTVGSAALVDGWYRIWATGVATGAESELWVILMDADTTVYSGDGASGLYLWGAQLDRAGTPRTYGIDTRSITFTDFLVPDGTLSVNAEERSITSNVAGPFYGDDEAITFSDPDQWWVLPSGTSTVTDGLSASDTIKHRGSFS